MVRASAEAVRAYLARPDRADLRRSFSASAVRRVRPWPLHLTPPCLTLPPHPPLHPPPPHPPPPQPPPPPARRIRRGRVLARR